MGFRSRIRLGLLSSGLILLLVLAAPAVLAAPVARDVSDTCGPASSAGFVDVSTSNVHGSAIDCVSYYSVTVGVGGNKYAPAETLSRGQLHTFVVRSIAAGGFVVPEAGEVSDFFIDDDGSVHEHSSNVLAHYGILSSENGRSYIHEYVSRSEMAGLVAGVLFAAGYAEVPVEDFFTDDGADPYQYHIDTIAHAGIITGYGDGTYGPNELLRRDQMATFLARLIDTLWEIPRADNEPEPDPVEPPPNYYPEPEYPPYSPPGAGGFDPASCTYDGVPLHGRVQIVDYMPDFRVQSVNYLPDLRVQLVDYLPSSCGRWQIVDYMPDFRVQFVDYLPDFSVQFVDYLPGS